MHPSRASSRSGALRAAGEGALAGLLAGVAIGTWDVILNADLRHGMPALAAARMFRPAAAGASAGVVISVALEALLLRLRSRSRGAAAAAAAGCWVAALAGAAAAAWPLRPRLFPLYRFSDHALSVAVFGVVAGSALALLALRTLDATSESEARFGRAIEGFRKAAARAGVWFLILSVAGWLALPAADALRSAGRRPVILVSLDTLRADRAGFLGNHRGLTPRLDALAAEGVVFEQAHAPAPWTLPSHVSLFSSRLPLDHKVRWDANRMDLSLTMLAEHFRNAGYRTAAFTGGAYVAAYFGFSQGFEAYVERDEVRDRGPGRIASAALRWVRENRRVPFFLFVHTYEPHSPFDHPDLAHPGDAGRLEGSLGNRQVEAIHRGELVLTGAERRYVADLYDGDVAQTDRVFGGLLDTLRRDGILDRAVLVVLSDHGEDLWDHDLARSPSHGHTLYQDVLRVPLFVRAPGIAREGLRVRAPVSLLDVAPTLLALAGLPSGPGFQGRNLSGVCGGGAEPPPAPILAEAVEAGPERFSAREGDVKVILAPRPESPVNEGVWTRPLPLEVYDLRTDPAERNNLSGDDSETVRRLVGILWERAGRTVPGLGRPDSPDGDLPPDLLERLRSLGYIR
jgi:arylsulfatase A-like enzyme